MLGQRFWNGSEGQDWLVIQSGQFGGHFRTDQWSGFLKDKYAYYNQNIEQMQWLQFVCTFSDSAFHVVR